MEDELENLPTREGAWNDIRNACLRYPALSSEFAAQIYEARTAVFTLNALQQYKNMAPAELVTKTGDDETHVPIKTEITEQDDYEPVQTSDKIVKPNGNNEEPNDESDTTSTSSSHHSINNHPMMLPHALSSLALEKEGTVNPIFNNWIIGAYTAMLGRLSAMTSTLDSTQTNGTESESDSEMSQHSSYTDKSHGSHSSLTRRGYTCGTCGFVAPTRPALKKHITNSHPINMANHSNTIGDIIKCSFRDSEFTTSRNYEMDAHLADHVGQNIGITNKKRPVNLQRVRYRYEREEYRCSLCSYACTIEKAFQRHLRAHAKGNASETRVSCAVCGADRSSEVDLSRHMRRHREDRFFCCDICIFRTVQLKKLIQHRRMHTGEKPHLCPHCAYRSARRDNLRSHVRRVHKKENLYCDTFSPRGMLISPKVHGTETSSTAMTISSSLDRQDQMEIDEIKVPIKQEF